MSQCLHWLLLNFWHQRWSPWTKNLKQQQENQVDDLRSVFKMAVVQQSDSTLISVDSGDNSHRSVQHRKQRGYQGMVAPDGVFSITTRTMSSFNDTHDGSEVHGDVAFDPTSLGNFTEWQLSLIIRRMGDVFVSANSDSSTIRCKPFNLSISDLIRQCN